MWWRPASCGAAGCTLSGTTRRGRSSQYQTRPAPTAAAGACRWCGSPRPWRATYACSSRVITGEALGSAAGEWEGGGAGEGPPTSTGAERGAGGGGGRCGWPLLSWGASPLTLVGCVAPPVQSKHPQQQFHGQRAAPNTHAQCPAASTWSYHNRPQTYYSQGVRQALYRMFGPGGQYSSTGPEPRPDFYFPQGGEEGVSLGGGEGGAVQNHSYGNRQRVHVGAAAQSWCPGACSSRFIRRSHRSSPAHPQAALLGQPSLPRPVPHLAPAHSAALLVSLPTTSCCLRSLAAAAAGTAAAAAAAN